MVPVHRRVRDGEFAACPVKLVSRLGEDRRGCEKSPAQETRVRVPPGPASVYPSVGGDSAGPWWLEAPFPSPAVRVKADHAGLVPPPGVLCCGVAHVSAPVTAFPRGPVTDGSGPQTLIVDGPVVKE